LFPLYSISLLASDDVSCAVAMTTTQEGAAIIVYELKQDIVPLSLHLTAWRMLSDTGFTIDSAWIQVILALCTGY